MGWKTVKERYKIGHTVHVVGDCIWIGSAYISKIIAIGPDGNVRSRGEQCGGISNGELLRYLTDFDRDTEALRLAVQAEDQFSASITVYTYSGSKIIEKLCEVPGWPNVTHDGQIMYDNTHFTDRDKAVECAKSNASAAVSLLIDSVEADRSRLHRRESQLLDAIADAIELGVPIPDSSVIHEDSTMIRMRLATLEKFEERLRASDCESSCCSRQAGLRRSIQWLDSQRQNRGG